ncbi:MAG: TrkA family potassium uptake protein [Ruminococcus sp.]|jgi:trk system potassium uptake protein TrkA|nr:TrkA family potassium uptake protein [Ruminococcus sp.]
MKVTIVGGGKVGYYLIRTLLEHKHQPTVIEVDKGVCERLANELEIPVVCGDATRIDTLESAAVEHSSAFISVTGYDQVNLIACQLARNKFGIKKTIAKSNNPKNVEIMKRLGIDNVINSTDSIAMMIEREVDISKIKQLLTLNHGEVSISQIDLPEDYAWDGKLLKDIKSNILFNIVSITRGETLMIPRGETELHSGDKLLVISESDSVKSLKNILKIKNP